MGCCASSDSSAVAVTAAGAPISIAENGSLPYGRNGSSKRWIGWMKHGADEKKKKGGGYFDRKEVSGGRDDATEELLLMPGRMFMNGAREVACLFTQQGKKRTN
ncbi:putative protein phosphatase 2C 33 [Platanthera guangdongensis]|uniref:Uncharacterized protein n=1 Tax=Platanthera guangdongensis TaxID=2320717 RepID=A0ABR2N364_9ASPA